jgi:ORF6N domain
MPMLFPRDFCFQLTAAEWEVLRCQSGISKGRGGRRYAPYAFSEQGVAMLSSVLNSAVAIEVNVQIMRAFVKLREMLSTLKDRAKKLAELEKKYDHPFAVVFDVIRKLMEPRPVPKNVALGLSAATTIPSPRKTFRRDSQFCS